MFYIKNLSGNLGHERLTIRSFRTSQAMHTFLNAGDNGLRWQEYDGPLYPGKWAMLGGKWQNVKSIHPSLLAFC